MLLIPHKYRQVSLCYWSHLSEFVLLIPHKYRQVSLCYWSHPPFISCVCLHTLERVCVITIFWLNFLIERKTGKDWMDRSRGSNEAARAGRLGNKISRRHLAGPHSDVLAPPTYRTQISFISQVSTRLPWPCCRQILPKEVRGKWSWACISKSGFLRTAPSSPLHTHHL